MVLDLAIDNLAAGMPVVLVAPFTAERTDPAAWAAARDRLMAAGGTPLLVWLRLEPTEVLRRLSERDATRDAAKLADEAAYLARLADGVRPARRSPSRTRRHPAARRAGPRGPRRTAVLTVIAIDGRGLADWLCHRWHNPGSRG